LSKTERGLRFGSSKNAVADQRGSGCLTPKSKQGVLKGTWIGGASSNSALRLVDAMGVVRLLGKQQPDK